MSLFSLKIKSFVLDFIFPPFCVNCHQEGDFVCPECVKQIIPVVSQVCPECQKLSLQGRYHSNCKKGKELKGIICASYFEEGPIREMVHNFKYNAIVSLAEPLSNLMNEALRENFKLPITNFKSNANDPIFKHLEIKNSLKINNLKLIITYVPLHWRRQAERGYNQAEILAREIGANLNIEVRDLLIKTHGSKRQAQLSGSNRRKNLQGLFKLKTNIDIQNAKIIIVDDITTTGSTLNECAGVLKQAGAKEVWGLVVARG